METRCVGCVPRARITPCPVVFERDYHNDDCETLQPVWFRSRKLVSLLLFFSPRSFSLLLSFFLPLSLPLCLFFFSSPVIRRILRRNLREEQVPRRQKGMERKTSILKVTDICLPSENPRHSRPVLNRPNTLIGHWYRPLMRAANISSIPGWLLRISKNRSKYRIGYEMNFSLHIGTHRGRRSSSFSMNAMMTEKFPIFPSRFKRIILDRAKILFFFFNHSSRMKNVHGDLINRNHDKNTESAE